MYSLSNIQGCEAQLTTTSMEFRQISGGRELGLQMKKRNLNVSFICFFSVKMQSSRRERAQASRGFKEGGTWSLKKIIAFFLGEKCRLQIVLGLLGIAKNSSAPSLLQLFISTEMVIRRIFP
jgi:hypothetical protein